MVNTKYKTPVTAAEYRMENNSFSLKIIHSRKMNAIPAAKNGTYLQRIRNNARSERTSSIRVQPCLPSSVESAPLNGVTGLQTDWIMIMTERSRITMQTAFGNIFGPGSPIAEADLMVELEINRVNAAATAKRNPTIVFPVIFFIFYLFNLFMMCFDTFSY